MRKSLIICQTCQTKSETGIRKWVGMEIKRPFQSILGEIADDGSFLIKRFHNQYTKIVGNDFAVICGVCGEPTYIRKEVNGNSNIGNIWFSRTTFIGTLQGTVSAG